MLHKDATYKTYQSFLDRLATELDTDIGSVEVRFSKEVEIGSDDEKALTKAIEHTFSNASRLLCTKHLKDNVKHHLQTKIGMDRKERVSIMTKLFDRDTVVVNANTTIEFEEKSQRIPE
jgi:transposase-like protein